MSNPAEVPATLSTTSLSYCRLPIHHQPSMEVVPKALGTGKQCAEPRTLTEDLDRTGSKFERADIFEPVDLWAKFEPPSISPGVLPDIVERFALDQSRATGGDIAGIAAGALAVCAAAIPDDIKVQVKRHNADWQEAARLWVALVGPVSSMKTPIMATVVRPLRSIDCELMRSHQQARASYDQLAAEERRASGPPKQKRVLLQDTTIEAAQEVIKDSPNGLLCYHDELSGWFGAMDKYSGGRGAAKDRAFWLEAYNGKSYAVNRVGRGAVLIENLSVSMLGGIQPEPIRRLSEDSQDDGLLQRLMPIVLRPAVVGQDEAPNAVVTDYSQLIRDLCQLNSSLIGGSSPDQAKTLKLSDGAHAIRHELEIKHLELQRCETINRKLAAHIGKYNGLFARLCVVWHCIEHSTGVLPAEIPEETARQVAGFLHGFLLPHALAFYAGVLGLSNDHDRLTAVAGYILARRLEKITNRDVQRGDSTMRKLDRRDVHSIFDQLDALGWITREAGPRPTHQLHWLVNPAVHRKFADRARTEADRRQKDRALIAGLMERAEEGRSRA
jgi:Protein of unknown function (DUF3987)